MASEARSPQLRLESLQNWTLPPRIVRMLGDARFRLEGPLLALHVGPHGDAWSVEEPGVLRHWTVETGREHSQVTLSDLELSWCFSNNGRWLASAADDWSLWDIHKSSLLLTKRQPSWVTALFFLPDGERLSCRVEVRYARSEDAQGRTRVGGRFVELDPQRRRALARLVADLQRQQIRKAPK